MTFIRREGREEGRREEGGCRAGNGCSTQNKRPVAGCTAKTIELFHRLKFPYHLPDLRPEIGVGVGVGESRFSAITIGFSLVPLFLSITVIIT